MGADPIPATSANNRRSLDFIDPSQLVAIPDNAAFELTHSLTLEAYIDARSNSGGSQIVFRGDDRSAVDPYYLTLSGGSLFFVIEDETNGVAINAPFTLLNQWAHVAGTLDDTTGAMRLFIDGQQVTQTTSAIRPVGPLDSNLNPGIGIGNLQSLATYSPQAFDGLIDEVRISDVALPPSQFLNAVPEPSTLVLAGLGFVSLHFAYRRAKKDLS